MAAVVEHWNSFTKIRQDLFGWIDIVAAHPNHPGILAVQTTTGANAAARVQKAKGNGALVAWLLAGGRLAVYAWSKHKQIKSDGTRGRRDVWTLREIPVGLEELNESSFLSPGLSPVRASRGEAAITPEVAR